MAYGGLGQQKPGYRQKTAGPNQKEDATGRSSGQEGGQRGKGYPHKMDKGAHKEGQGPRDAEDLQPNAHVTRNENRGGSTRRANDGVGKRLPRPSP